MLTHAPAHSTDQHEHWQKKRSDRNEEEGDKDIRAVTNLVLIGATIVVRGKPPMHRTKTKVNKAFEKMVPGPCLTP